jgi:type I restriction-modification system DNA methylase subunit
VSKKKSQQKTEDLLRIAIFVLLDALVFHEVLASVKRGVTSLKQVKSHYQKFLLTEWQKVLNNYEAIFWLPNEILNNFPTSLRTESLLKQLADKALDIVASGILLKHDFMGRIYHKLLLRTTGKYYATFYTSIPAAWLLANLVFQSPHPAWNFADIENIKNFRVIDPACGSGTLLSAAYMAMKHRYIIESQASDLHKFHKVCMEDILYGWDILDYAAHLTLMTLALHNYRSGLPSGNIYTLKAGVERVKGQDVVHLGSLDYLSKQLAFKGWGFTAPVISKGVKGDKREQQIPIPKADVVIMNPPFSRSANPNVKFGYSEKKVKKEMDKELSKLTKQLKMRGIGQAGLGPYFILLADRLLKDNGRMGIVIPRSMLSGVSWSKIRQKLMADYEVEYIVSNHDPGDRSQGIESWNWSENTDLSEVLIVARKAKAKIARDPKVLYINLWNKPKNEVESLWLSQQILRRRKSLSGTLLSNSWDTLKLGSKEIGAMYYVPQQDINYNWLAPCLFANPELNRFVMEIIKNRTNLIPLSKISRHLGVDCSTVSREVQVTSIVTPLPVVWGHHLSMNTIDATGYTQYANGPSRLQEYRGNVLIPYTLYLQNHKIAALFSPQDVLSNAFWTVKIANSNHAKLITLWLNSTFGFLLLLSIGIASRGFHFEFKKENLKQLLVVNPCLIDQSQVNILYQKLQNRPFECFAEEFSQAYQGKGLRKVIDNFFIQQLGYHINTNYYDMLSREPIFTLKRL